MTAIVEKCDSVIGVIVERSKSQHLTESLLKNALANMRNVMDFQYTKQRTLTPTVIHLQITLNQHANA